MVVVITGTSRGIGKALVEQFAPYADLIYAISSSAQSHFQALNNVVQLSADWKAFNPKEMGDQIKHKVDILINNAGALTKCPLAELEEQSVLHMLEANALLAFKLTRHIYNEGKFNSGAHVINISSMAGYQGASKFPGMAAYSIAKGALATLTECMHAEWGQSIRVNCLCIGAVNTEMLAAAFPGYKADVDPITMARFITQFALSARNVMSGKILPINLSDPG
ncbi:MAG: SDR family oxidoreductase [Salibacteraceae bacterium]